MGMVGGESLTTAPLDEVADGGVVEHGIVNCQEAKPAISQIFADGGTQSPEGTNVVQGADNQSPDHYFGMDGGSPVVGAIAFLQRSYQLGEIKLLVNANQQMVGVDEVPQVPAGELEQSGISPVAIQWF